MTEVDAAFIVGLLFGVATAAALAPVLWWIRDPDDPFGGAQRRWREAARRWGRRWR